MILIIKDIFYPKIDTIVGCASGIVGGCIKYLTITPSMDFIETIIKSGVTALVCGFLGVAGKYLFNHLLKFIKSKLKKKN